MSPALGHVWLIGAGPGEPGLVTVAGLEALRRADVVVYDRLVSPALLDEAPAKAAWIDAGKRAGFHTMTQEAINALLIDRARAGRRVVRLKGGDPFVFGRGGEEALALAAAGVPCTVVPGVSSATAGPGAAGIPLTHRRTSGSFAVVSGHAEAGDPTERERWRLLAGAADTLVVLMGAERLDAIARALVAAGRDPGTPAAVIERATLGDQRVVSATLSEIAARAASAGIAPPALLTVGDTVSLAEGLSPARLNPLGGRRVLVTRPAERAGELARLLAIEGAEAVVFPLLRVEPLDVGSDVADATGRLRAGRYRWLAFTSATAVELWFGHLRALGSDARALGVTQVCAVGPATARALEAHGIMADLVPREATGAAAAAALRASQDLSGVPVLLPRASDGDRSLPDGLAAAGAIVDELAMYTTVAVNLDSASTGVSSAPTADVVTLLSPSAARAWAAYAGDGPLAAFPVACIGPTTAAAAAAAGLEVGVVADEQSDEGIVAALRWYFTMNAGRCAP